MFSQNKTSILQNHAHFYYDDAVLVCVIKDNHHNKLILTIYIMLFGKNRQFLLETTLFLFKKNVDNT
jgi:hypothetical protein